MIKKSSEKKTAVLNVRLTPERMKQLTEVADSLETTPSMLVRGWIAEKLKQKN